MKKLPIFHVVLFLLENSETGAKAQSYFFGLLRFCHIRINGVLLHQVVLRASPKAKMHGTCLSYTFSFCCQWVLGGPQYLGSKELVKKIDASFQERGS